MSQKHEFSLIVQEAVRNGDVGRDIARISWEIMDEIGLSSGDIIEIENLKTTYATVYPISAVQSDTLCIDGKIRGQAEIGILERAMVQKADPKQEKC